MRYNIIMNIEYTRRLEKIEAVLLANLPRQADRDWIASSFFAVPDAVRINHIDILLDPCRDLLARGGKRWRPLLMVLACELAGGGERAYALTPIIEFSHTASLIHDDIEDHAETRRGKPAIHLIYGEDVAINSASWLYFHALSVIDVFPCSESFKLILFKIATREIRKLHLGQAMDIKWHRDPGFLPVRAEYEAMVMLKTGTLPYMAGEIGMLTGGKDAAEARSFGELSAKIGVGFQVLDDVRNLTTGNPGKKRGDDIVEGKKSLPVIMHLEKHPEDNAFFSQAFIEARQEGIDSPYVEKIIERLSASGAIEQARQYGNQLIERSCLSLRGRYPGKEEADLIADLFDSMRDGLRE
ncbi:polyprenyl synthetase family protein [Brucepastera parasyntrophica]|uniref:polyprenyl synthetase family protein n=1 Tax=Brucepastera parasyntrophica TaxID=2880008 RepID=UPI00210BE5D4|nr:polyprenyl synthetase family protein [Brucepastera parasyntrophica]ULQ61100.1 polyprenyl synthetase family protein [Brucepastera parasyntrophica]